eukprot:10568977-Karenia_brevis.AAC.1
MSHELVEALRDANGMFKETFENAYAASKLVEKAKKQRITENPAASPVSDAEVKPKKEQEKHTGGKSKTID